MGNRKHRKLINHVKVKRATSAQSPSDFRDVLLIRKNLSTIATVVFMSLIVLVSTMFLFAGSNANLVGAVDGKSPIVYKQDPQTGNIRATGGIYSEWFGPVDGAEFMHMGNIPAECKGKTKIQCGQAKNPPHSSTFGLSAGATDPNNKAMIFTKVANPKDYGVASGELYELNFPGLSDLYNPATSVKNDCKYGLKVTKTTSQGFEANLVGLPGPAASGQMSASNTMTYCASEFEEKNNGLVENGLPSINTKVTVIADNTGNGSTSVTTDKNIFHGLSIPACSAENSRDYTDCVKRRKTALGELDKKCKAISNSADSGECQRVRTCMLQDSTKTSMQCQNSGTAGKDKAERWRDGDTKDVKPGMSDEEINSVCDELGNKEDAEKCVENAKKAKEDAVTEAADAETEDEPVCDGGSLGYIMCPLVETISSVNDWLFDTIVAGILDYSPMLGDPEKVDPVRNAWESFTNLANIGLAIVFLILVYSMATGSGVSNLNVKRILPRLVVGALAINLSYYVCAVAVDLSNILGQGLGELLSEFTPSHNPGWAGLLTGIILAGAGVAGSAVAIMTLGDPTTAVWIVGLAAVVALLAFLAAVITMWVRNLVIMLCVVLSPVAFLMFLLPNTQSWGKRWAKIFTQMLMMFPLAALLFSGARFAGGLMAAAAGNNGFQQLGGMLVMAVPMFLLPWLMRKTGGMLAAVQGGLNKLSGRGSSAIKTTANAPERREYRKSAYLAKGPGRRRNVIRNAIVGRDRRERLRTSRTAANKAVLDANYAQREATIGTNEANTAQNLQVQQLRKGSFEKVASKNLAETLQKDPTLAMVAGGDTEEGQRYVQNQANAELTKAMTEAIKNVELSADINPGDMNALKTKFTEALSAGDMIGAQAYQNMMLTSGGKGVSTFREAMDVAEQNNLVSTDMSSTLRNNVLNNHGSIKGTDADVMEWAANSGGRSLSTITNNPDTYKNLSSAEKSSQRATTQSIAVANMSKTEAEIIAKSPELLSKFTPDNRDEVIRIAK